MFGKYLRNKKGLTLVEVLVSTALLLLVFTGFVNAFYYSVNLKVNSQSRLQAMLKAQGAIEEIRGSRGELAGEWSDIDELADWLVYSAGYRVSGAGEYKNANVVVTLTGSDAGIPDELIPVYVKVSYEDQMNKGQEKSVKLHTRLREF